jgi:hypothetical protein
MSDHYRYAISQLCLALNLSVPAKIEDVISLQVGDYACHLTEHPIDNLLMFISLTSIDESLVPAQNLFSQELCKPLLGVDPATGAKVLWNRLDLKQMDRATAHNQLETLVSTAEHLSGAVEQPTPPPDTQEMPESVDRVPTRPEIVRFM